MTRPTKSVVSPVFRGLHSTQYTAFRFWLTGSRTSRYYEPAWLMRATLAAGAAWILLRRFALKLTFSTWMVIGTSAVCLIFLPNLLFRTYPEVSAVGS